MAPGVAGIPGLAIAAATWVGRRDGGKERDSTRAAHNVREGTRGTGWTAALSLGAGTGTQSKATPGVDASTEDTEEFFCWLLDRIVPTPGWNGRGTGGRTNGCGSMAVTAVGSFLYFFLFFFGGRQAVTGFLGSIG